MVPGRYILIIALVTFTVLISGCLESGNGSGGINSVKVMNGTHFIAAAPEIHEGASVVFNVVSDGPVNLIIMDRDNYTKFFAAEQGGPVQWSACAIAINVTGGSLRFTAPYSGNYTFIVDNSQLVEGSKVGISPITFSANYTFSWSNDPKL